MVPKQLRAALPFASKPKDTPSRKRPLLENRRPAVVMEPHERKVHALVQHLQLIRNEKVFAFRLKYCSYLTYLKTQTKMLYLTVKSAGNSKCPLIERLIFWGFKTAVGQISEERRGRGKESGFQKSNYYISCQFMLKAYSV